MKKFRLRYLLVLCLLISSMGFAQKIKLGEYFFDIDPGVGNGTAFPAFTNFNDSTLNFSVATNSLSVGDHYLFTRFCDVNGKWSHYEGRHFNIYTPGVVASSPRVSAAEYFFDTDPGVGNGVAFPAFTNFNDSTLNFSVATNSLSVGDHYLFTRFRGVNGKWGHYEGRHFNIYSPGIVASSSSIVAAEYFYDTDPGPGNGVAFPAFSAFSSATMTLSANVSTLTVGNHYLFTRFKDASGKWGHYESRHLYVYTPAVVAPSPSVVAGEYFFDTDPGPGNATAMPVMTAFSNATINLAASSTAPFSAGTHNLFTRFIDAGGRWGHYEGRSFTVCAVVPQSQFTVTNACVGSSVNIINTSTNAASYAWDMNNDAITDYTTSSNFSYLFPTAGTYTVNLTTTSSSGCSDVAIHQVTVYPVPTVTANATSSIVCSGNSVTLTGSGADTYTWTNSVINGLGFVPLVNATYSVTGTNTLTGCTNTNSASKLISISPSPTIVVNSATICSGGSVALVPFASGIAVFNITGGNFTVSPTTYTTYSVTGTSTNGCVSSNTAVASVSVNISPTITVNSSTICSGGSAVITPTAAGISVFNITGNSFTVSPIANATYSVTGTGTNGCVSSNTAVTSVSVNTTPTITVNSAAICSGNSVVITPTAAGISSFNITGGTFSINPVSNTSYSVTGTSTNGCVSSNTAVSSVTVYTLPIITVSSGSICNGQSFNLNAGGALTYTYSGGSAIVSPTVTSTYTVSGTNASGCVSANSSTASIVVNQLPVITVNSGTICLGTSFVIIPGGSSTYTLNGSSSNFTVSPIANTSYSVTGTSSSGCLSSNAAISTVTVVPLPVITVNSASICAGTVFTMVPSGAISYTYSSGSATVNPSTNTSFSVAGSNAEGCISGTAAVSNVTVNALPIINITSNSTLICVGEIASYTATGAFTYTWSGGETANTITVSPPTNSTYTVSGKDSSGCINTSLASLQVSQCTGIEMNIEGNSEIILYPNPNGGQFIVIVPKDVSAFLFNSMGQLIRKEALYEGKNTLSLNECAKGIYFIEINEGTKKYNKKLIVQ